MADLNIVLPGKGKKYSRPSLKIDMTPMVDLGFLLISFFIFTTSISTPAVTKLFMPADGVPSKLGESNALTLLLGNNNTLFY
jgi:biopolymer transport protein ExbD